MKKFAYFYKNLYLFINFGKERGCVGEGVYFGVCVEEINVCARVYVRVCANEYPNRHFQVLISSIGNFKKFLHIIIELLKCLFESMYKFCPKEKKSNELVNMN